MPATVLTAITPFSQKVLCQNEQAVFQVVVNSLNQFLLFGHFWFPFLRISHSLMFYKALVRRAGKWRCAHS